MPTITSSRLNPVDIGTMLKFSKVDDREGLSELDITVNQIIRGDGALTMMKSASERNLTPDTDSEYLLASVTVSIPDFQNWDEIYELTGQNFILVASTGKEYSKILPETPAPRFGTSLVQGDSHTGWVVFIVDKNDPDPLITFDRNPDRSGGAWFKTVK